jgi:serine/threonine-protein kinase RsbT
VTAAVRLTVSSPVDAERACRSARVLARELGFSAADAERVSLAVSELATNLVRHADGGELRLAIVQGPRGRGVQVESRDVGPGIADLDLALEDGYSTTGGLGSGLPATRRLMDEFTIASDGRGTRVVARKWPLPA